MKKETVILQAEKEELLPVYASSGASGADLKANIEQDVIIPPKGFKLIPTGVKVEIPVGFEIQVRPRSGLAFKSGITVLNTPGTIDADYRGDIGVILINLSDKEFTVTPFMRIAQMVLAPVYQAEFILQNELSSTERGRGGFGHTGTH
ncbi:MAG: dUTP diphosphatase [Chlamydiota bacterium]|jgi:dUTP pyrophosphatase